VLDNDVRQELAHQIFDAQVHRMYLEPITATHPACEVEDAYLIAQLVTEAKVAAGRTVKGHKIGLTSQVIRDLSGSDEPDYGTLFDDMFVPEGSTVTKSAYNRGVAVEVELAFVLKDRLAGPKITPLDVIRATEWVLPAIEIVDSRYTRPGPGPLVIDSVADSAWCGGIVLGANPRSLSQFDVRKIEATLFIDGEVRASGWSSAVMGSPVNSVAWLANKLSEFGVVLEPGHLVMSGSFTTITRIRAGNHVRVAFDLFGDVEFSVSD
jgi:2-keto-4-pentenoate hydratase